MAIIRQVDATCLSVTQLAVATEEAFLAHPDAEVITSFPGLSVLSGARVLAEIGDDRERFADARAIKAYAGAAPVTRAPAEATWSWPGPSRTSAASGNVCPGDDFA